MQYAVVHRLRDFDLALVWRSLVSLIGYMYDCAGSRGTHVALSTPQATSNVLTLCKHMARDEWCRALGGNQQEQFVSSRYAPNIRPIRGTSSKDRRRRPDTSSWSKSSLSYKLKSGSRLHHVWRERRRGRASGSRSSLWSPFSSSASTIT